jgi:hypothetical protein
VAAVAATRLVGLLNEAIVWVAKIAPVASNTEFGLPQSAPSVEFTEGYL